MPVDVSTFQEVLDQTAGEKRHLVLGNGFSIALFPDRFRYGSLLGETDFSEYLQIREVFDRLKTTDFEVVIKALRVAVAFLPIYVNDVALLTRLDAHAEILKDLLVRAIAGRHPERPSEIAEEQYGACRTFLAHFVGAARNEKPSGGKDLRGYIYSLNYDLLLYWALLHEQVLNWNADDPLSSVFEKTEVLLHDDGFRAPEDEPDAPYVTWEAEDAANSQNIHFLHGALHLYDDGPDLKKKCWERSGGVPLIDQIRAELSDGRFPLFVSEGDSDSKLERIRHSGYLQRSLRSFASVCRSPSVALFVFGHSFGPTDEHILRLLERGKFGRLYVSLYGDAGSAGNQSLVRRVQRMPLARHEKYPLEVRFFDATSASVWG